MSRALAAAVPPPLRAVLDAGPGAPEADGFTLLLLTVREDGWPHQAMLSVGEVAVRADGGVALALWPGSTATRLLRASGCATLTAVVGGVGYLLLLETAERPPLRTPLAGELARFDARVVEARADEAPYAELLGGVRFRLRDHDGAVRRWREVREELAR